jgi:diguanylate cyclase (GGDEF)-like protein
VEITTERTAGQIHGRARWWLWVATGALVVADAIISTPIGLSFLLVVPVSFAAFLLPRVELIVLTGVCVASRVFFGPVGDPLGLRTITLEVSGPVQLWMSAFASMAVYPAVAFTFRAMSRQRQRLAQLKTQSERDPLTNAWNRRGLASFLSRHPAASASVIVVDADHFKRINDTYGHEGGDRVLQELAKRLQATIRSEDLVARTGGEEFVLVLPGAPRPVAERLAQRILSSMRERPFDVGRAEPVPVTVSVGCATGPLDSGLIGLADEALYQAKQTGRDRFVVAGHPSESPVEATTDRGSAARSQARSTA